MKRKIIILCICLLGVIVPSRSQVPGLPQTLEEAEDRISLLLLPMNVVFDVKVQNGTLTLRYAIPEYRKAKPDWSKTTEQELKDSDIRMAVWIEQQGVPCQGKIPEAQKRILSSTAGEKGNRYWKTILFHAPVDSGRSNLHVLLSYNADVDRQLVDNLLKAAGIDTEKDWYVRSGYTILTLYDAEALLQKRAYKDVRQRFTGWLVIKAKDGKKYACKAGWDYDLARYLRENNLPTKGFKMDWKDIPFFDYPIN